MNRDQENTANYTSEKAPIADWEKSGGSGRENALSYEQRKAIIFESGKANNYDREKAIEYAHKWAHVRNPSYYSFSGIGGDCTNFISQCLYAGCGVMNYAKDVGWYYGSAWNRAAAWTGVEYLYNFLTTNKDAGPFARELPLEEAQPGDIVQLSFNGKTFGHSLFIVETEPEILIATHTDDSDYRPLSSYYYLAARLLHIDGARGQA